MRTIRRDARAAGRGLRWPRAAHRAGQPGIEVADTKLALGNWPRLARAFTLPLIAVAGSNGKTTVTQMIASILRACQGDAAFPPKGNFNNDIGLPLTLLRLHARAPHRRRRAGHEPPRRDRLPAGIARPTVALVNNAQREHQEFMATVEAVARENGTVIEALGADGVRGVSRRRRIARAVARAGGQAPRLTFGSRDEADTAWPGLNGSGGQWAVPADACGPGGVGDSMSRAATTCATRWLQLGLAAGVPVAAISAGARSLRAVKGRSRALAMQLGGRTLTLVDDSYNANPIQCAPPSTYWPVARAAPAGARRHGRSG